MTEWYRGQRLAFLPEQSQCQAAEYGKDRCAAEQDGGEPDGKGPQRQGAAQKTGKNITETGKKLNLSLTEFEKTMPKHIKMIKYFDQSVSVDMRLSRFAKDFGIAILLVALTLLPLGLRAP